MTVPVEVVVGDLYGELAIHADPDRAASEAAYLKSDREFLKEQALSLVGHLEARGSRGKRDDTAFYLVKPQRPSIGDDRHPFIIEVGKAAPDRLRLIGFTQQGAVAVKSRIKFFNAKIIQALNQHVNCAADHGNRLKRPVGI